MDIILSICAIVVTIIIACLAYSVIMMLKQVKSTLGVANSTLEEAKITIHDLRAEMGQVSQNTNKVIQDTNAITEDVQKKMKDLDIWFGTLKEVGTAVYSLTASIRQTAAGAAKSKREMRQASRAAKQAADAAERHHHTSNSGQASRVATGHTTRQGSDTTDRHTSGQAAQLSPTFHTIMTITDGIASSIRLWNQLKQNNKPIQ